MTTNSREKLFWLGCGLVILIATKAISWQLCEAARLSHVAADKTRETNEESPSSMSKDGKQGTEDDVTIETLAVLIDHPNYDIRHAARRIVLNRFANSADCCIRLCKDYFQPGKQTDAAAVLKELFRFADEDSLIIRARDSGDSENTSTTIDGILRVAAEERSNRISSSGPVVTLEEVGGDNGEVISLRLGGTTGNTFIRTVSQQREESPEELALRRWRRREAMVVEVDAEEGVAELVLPS